MTMQAKRVGTPLAGYVLPRRAECVIYSIRTQVGRYSLAGVGNPRECGAAGPPASGDDRRATHNTSGISGSAAVISPQLVEDHRAITAYRVRCATTGHGRSASI